MLSETAVSAPKQRQKDIFEIQHEFAISQASIHQASIVVTAHRWLEVDSDEVSS